MLTRAAVKALADLILKATDEAYEQGHADGEANVRDNDPVFLTGVA